MSTVRHDHKYPLDRHFFAETADGTIVRLNYWPGGSAWAGEPLFACADEDGAAYAAVDLGDWADTRAALNPSWATEEQHSPVEMEGE